MISNAGNVSIWWRHHALYALMPDLDISLLSLCGICNAGHSPNLAVSFIHYDDFIMGAMASQITSLTIVYTTVYSDADHRKLQSSASLAFMQGIHRGPVNFPHKVPVTRKVFPFDDVIMLKNSEKTSHSSPFIRVSYWVFCCINSINEVLALSLILYSLLCYIGRYISKVAPFIAHLISKSEYIWSRS